MRTGAYLAVASAMLLCTATLTSAQGPFGGGPFGGGPGGGGGGQCNTGCCNSGNTVLHGACSSFANYFKNDADTAVHEDSSAFAKRVAAAPTPSDRCCIDGRSFTQYGCSCNQSLKDAAQGQGWSNNAIAVIARAVQYSVCANSQHGGYISSGGC